MSLPVADIGGLEAPPAFPGLPVEAVWMYMRASLLSLLVAGSIVATFATGGRAQQTGGADPGAVPETKPAWQVPAEGIFPLDDLMDRGLMPVVREDMNPAQPGPPRASLQLVNLERGSIAWSAPLGSTVDAMNVLKDTLIVALGESVAALSITDGSVLWEQPVEGMVNTGGALSPEFAQAQWFVDRHPEVARAQGIGGALLVANGKVHIGVSDTVYCLDPATGQPVWHSDVGFSLLSPLVNAGGLILANTADGLAALAGDTGAVAWRAERAVQVDSLGDGIYCLMTDRLRRLDPKTGEDLWATPLAPRRLYLAGGKLVVLGAVDVTILDAATGRVAWSARRGNAAPAVSGGLLFFSPEETDAVTCVSLTDLTEKWTEQVTLGPPWALVAVGDVVAALNRGSFATGSAVDGFDAKKGTKLWTWQGGELRVIFTQTWAADDVAVYFHGDNWTMGLGVRTGRPVLTATGEHFSVEWMGARKGVLYMHGGGVQTTMLEAMPRGPEEP